MKRVFWFMGSVMLAVLISLEFVSLAKAHEPGAHVHGLAILEIIVDGATVQINLDSPLDNLLGFERAPGNEKERQAVKVMVLKFHQTDALFALTPAAQCRLESTRLESPVLAPGLLLPVLGSGKSAMPPPADLVGAHAGLEATWHFQCAAPQALQGLEVRLFQVFPGIKRINAAVAGPQGQSGAKLSPKSTRLKW